MAEQSSTEVPVRVVYVVVRDWYVVKCDFLYFCAQVSADLIETTDLKSCNNDKFLGKETRFFLLWPCKTQENSYAQAGFLRRISLAVKRGI